MILLKIAMRNLIRRPKRTILVAMLGFLGTLMIFFTEAIFEGTERGLQTSYAESLTGDFVIAQDVLNTTSIFGNDMPLVGDYFVPPEIAFFDKIAATLDNEENLSWSPVAMTAAKMQTADFSENVEIIGIDVDGYFDICRKIDTSGVDLNLLREGNLGISLPQSMQSAIIDKIGRDLQQGDEVTLTFSAAGAFTIEKGVFAGYHRYVNPESPFDRIVLSDPVIPRELMQFSVVAQDDIDHSDDIVDDLDDITAMFSSSNDIEHAVDEGAENILHQLEAELSRKQKPKEIAETSFEDSWNFILVKTPKNRKALETKLKKSFNKDELKAKVLDWKMAAGLPSQSAFAMQIIFSCGVVFIMVAAVLVLTNGLTISVIERVGEIGTMRAIGARRLFVGLLFFVETLILVMLSVLLGVIFGLALCYAITQMRIYLANPLLQTIFGGKYLVPIATGRLVLLHFAFGLAISALAWIYPVSIALKIPPAQVIGKK